jgi:hypothetical protein
MSRGREPRHGMSGTRIHHKWLQMKQRCLRQTHPRYADYGGRGIKVCDRWMTFENFLEDMGVPAPGMSLDRIDNDGDYSPENCRWVDASTQNRNKRCNLRISNGRTTLTLVEWSELTGIAAHTIRTRIARDGWDPKQAVETPVGGWRKPRLRNKCGRFTGDTLVKTASVSNAGSAQNYNGGRK